MAAPWDRDASILQGNPSAGHFRRREGAMRHPKNNKAARRRLCADDRRSYRQPAASAGTIPVAIAAKLVGVALVNVTGSPPFKVDGT
jgi:hypothetical protein